MRSELSRAWRWFNDLSEARRYTRTVEPEAAKDGRGMAWRVHTRPERISFESIGAWARVSGVSLAPWQLAAISLMDEAFVAQSNKPRDLVSVPDQAATTEYVKDIFNFFENKTK